MSRKNIMLIIVAVVLFGGAGFVLYRGFAGPSAPASTPASTGFPANAPAAASPGSPAAVSPGSITTGAGASPSSPISPAGNAASATAPALISSPRILPLGSSFDLTMVKKYNADGKLFSYPKVDPTEIGPALGDIVKKSQ
jgi:hypothetical protein